MFGGMWVAAKFALSGILGPAWIAKLIGVAAAVIGLVSGYLVWHHKVYLKGWNDHATAIAEENAAAVTANRELLNIVRGCKSRGLRFDQTTRQCGGSM